FLPPEQALLDQHLVRRRLRERPPDFLGELLLVLRDAAAGPAERKARAQDGGEAGPPDDLPRLLDGVRRAGLRAHEADLFHRRLEERAILRFRDRLRARAEELDTELHEHALFVELQREVQRRLSAERRQYGLRPLALEDGRERAPLERLDVRAYGELGVGHD